MKKLKYVYGVILTILILALYNIPSFAGYLEKDSNSNNVLWYCSKCN